MELREDPVLEGIVQTDEAWFGGKKKGMHGPRREELERDPYANKIMIQGFRTNNGQYYALPVGRPNARTLRESVLRYVAPGSTVWSDGEPAYRTLPRYGIFHAWVNHKTGEYVRDQITNNGVESFWALMKRGYHGIFHHISLHHIRRYVNEFTYRLNSGKGNGAEAMGNLIYNGIGRRLKWRVLMGREPADVLANA